MKLTFEDIKKITIGSIKTVETEKGIEFFKCTEKQIEAFKAKNEGFYKRSLATTGVRLDFVTNSEFVEFVVGEGHYELFVDELLVKQYTSEEDIADKYELDGKEHRISLIPTASEEPNIAVNSGLLSVSTDNTVLTTCTSFLKSSGNIGLIGRSIIRAASVAASVGRPSLLINPPGILPTEYNFSW